MGRSLLKKLGIQKGDHILLKNAPTNYFQLLEEDLPEDVILYEEPSDVELDFIHLFTNNTTELETLLLEYQDRIVQNGFIWVSWHKKSSKLNSEINEDIIRNTALALKLVDVKVCSVNEIWSALKLVIRVKLRK